MRFFLSACACKLLWLDLSWHDKAHTHIWEQKKSIYLEKEEAAAQNVEEFSLIRTTLIGDFKSPS